MLVFIVVVLLGFTDTAEIVATTSDGQAYVAGSGSTCEEAWQGMVLPEGWVDLRCVVTTH